jgi:hypothetical protein
VVAGLISPIAHACAILIAANLVTFRYLLRNSAQELEGGGVRPIRNYVIVWTTWFVSGVVDSFEKSSGHR